MEIQEFDVNKLVIQKGDHNKRILYYNDGGLKQLIITIPKEKILSRYPNKFNAERIDYSFDQSVRALLEQVDNFMRSKIKDPSKYKCLATQYIVVSKEFEHVMQPEDEVIELRLNLSGGIWSYMDKIGINPRVVERYQPKKLTRAKQSRIDELFID